MINQKLFNTQYLPSSGLVAIVGKNGAGKTNLVRHFLTEFPPTELLVFNSMEKLYPEYAPFAKKTQSAFNSVSYEKLSKGRHGERAVVIVDTPMTSDMGRLFKTAEADGILVVLIVQSESALPRFLQETIKVRFYAGRFSIKEIKTIYENSKVYIGQKTFSKNMVSVIKEHHQFFITTQTGEYFSYKAPKIEDEIMMESVDSVTEETLVPEKEPLVDEDDYIFVQVPDILETNENRCNVM